MELPSIKIPQLLSLAIAGDSRLQRGISITLYLKTFDTKGTGKLSWINFIDQAVRDLHVHEKTINNWLDIAIEHGLMTFRTHYGSVKHMGTYTLISWQDLATKYGCEANRFYYIKSQNIQFKFEYILKKYVIQEKQKQCEHACKIKYKYSLVAEELKNVVSELGITNSLSDLKNCQIYDFVTAGVRITDDQRFFINAANPDLNIGYKKLSEIFGYTSKGGMAYLKRTLEKCGLITVTKRQIPVQKEYRELMTTEKSRKTIIGQANYFRPAKTIVLTLTDNITMNPQTQWKCAPPDSQEKI